MLSGQETDQTYSTAPGARSGKSTQVWEAEYSMNIRMQVTLQQNNYSLPAQNGEILVVNFTTYHQRQTNHYYTITLHSFYAFKHITMLHSLALINASDNSTASGSEWTRCSSPSNVTTATYRS